MSSPLKFITNQVEIKDKFTLAKTWNKFHSIGNDLLIYSLNQAAIIGSEPYSFCSNILDLKTEQTHLQKILRKIKFNCKSNNVKYLKKSSFIDNGFPRGVLFSTNAKKNQFTTLKKGNLLVALSTRSINLLGYKLISNIIIKNNIQPHFNLKEIRTTVKCELMAELDNYYYIIKQIKEKYTLSGIVSLQNFGLELALNNFLPNNFGVEVLKHSFPYPTIYHYLQEWGKISTKKILSTFNLGMGCLIIIEPKEVEILMNFLISQNQEAYIIGEISRQPGFRWI